MAHPAKSLQAPHVVESTSSAAQPRDSALVRAASSLGASAAAGLVTAATFPAASVVLPIGLAVLGGAVVAMIGRHQAA